MDNSPLAQEQLNKVPIDNSSLLIYYLDNKDSCTLLFKKSLKPNCFLNSEIVLLSNLNIKSTGQDLKAFKNGW